MPGWLTQLRQGHPVEALASYLTTDQPELATIDALERLVSLQQHLRGKEFKQSLALLEASSPASLLDWARLKAQVARLQESAGLLDRRRPDEALTLLAEVDEAVLQGEAQTQRGTAHIFRSEALEAERSFAQALVADPRHYRALTNQGNLALEAGRVEEAIEAYQAAIKINPNFANAHHNLGVAYRRQGQIDKSVRAIKQSQRLLQQHDRGGARPAMRPNRGSPRLTRYLLYGAVAVIVILILRAQGIL
ncbi:MAG: tetratricopeptide repeat protein [Truepera sp.]|nr:tetratricopeptide repeat protein [Truepera sp.]